MAGDAARGVVVIVRGCETPIFFSWPLVFRRPGLVTRSAFAVEEEPARSVRGLCAGKPVRLRRVRARGLRGPRHPRTRRRHLDFFQHRTLLHARVPRVICSECGVHKVATPWARAGSGFTLFVLGVLTLAKAMPIAKAARSARRARHAPVAHRRALCLAGGPRGEVGASPPMRPRRRRGHDDISLFVDMARRKVMYVADGKDAATVKAFAEFLEAHGGKREAITDASIDMGAAFEAGIKENFPNAEITFDKFHVIKLANDAVDQVRREEARNDFQIKGRRYIFLKNVDHLTQEEKEALSRLEAQNLDTIADDADPHEPAAGVHDERHVGSSLSQALERLGWRCATSRR